MRGEDEEILVENAITLPDFEEKELLFLRNYDAADRVGVVFFLAALASYRTWFYEWMEDVPLRIPTNKNTRKPSGNSFLSRQRNPTCN